MKIVRELKTKMKINCVEKAYKYLKEFIDEDREHFIVLGLDTNKRPLYREIAHIGTIDKAIVSPAAIFRKAIVMNCNSIIIAHNHPSGDTEASEADLKINKALKEIGELIDIKVVDNIIIGNSYNSIIEAS